MYCVWDDFNVVHVEGDEMIPQCVKCEVNCVVCLCLPVPKTGTHALLPLTPSVQFALPNAMHTHTLASCNRKL